VFRTRSPLLIVVIALAVAISLATPASASVGIARSKVFHFVNDYRRSHGRHALRESRDVDRLAQHHSQAMATQRTLFHSSSLSTKLRAHDPSLWGENIGMGVSVWKVFKAWTRSSEHRQNMLRRGFRRAGVGVVWAHGAWWVTMIYYG
jgi:uncharacterized protein YkwD